MKNLVAPLVLSAGFVCTTASAEILVDLYQAAQQNDAQYQSDIAAVEASRENLNIAKAAIRPTVSLSGNGALNSGERELSNAEAADKDSTSWGYSLSLSQPLYNRQAFKAYDEAKAYDAVYQLQGANVHNDLIINTVALYSAVLQAKETILADKADVTALERQMTSAQDRLDVGLGTMIELNQAKASYALALASLAQSQSDLTLAEINLRRSVGYVPTHYEVLTEDAKRGLEEQALGTLDEWLAKIDQSIGYQIATQEAIISLKAAERIGGQRWPVLSLFAEHSYSDADDNIADINSRDTTNLIGLQLNQSIYQGGSLSAQSRQAKKQLYAAELNREAVYLRANAAITAAYDALVVGQKRLIALREGSAAADSVLAAQMDSFDVGVASQNDVLDAQQVASEARSNYVNALYEQVNIELQLRGAVNELDESVLARIDREWFESEN